MATYNGLKGDKVYTGIVSYTGSSPAYLVRYEGIRCTFNVDVTVWDTITGSWSGNLPTYIEGNANGFDPADGRTGSYPFIDDFGTKIVGYYLKSGNVKFLLFAQYDQTNTWKTVMSTQYSSSRIFVSTTPCYIENRDDGIVLLNKYGDGYQNFVRVGVYPNIFKTFTKYIFDSDNPPTPSEGDDPYNQGGTSDTGGGGGNFSDQSDNIGFSGVPDYEITNSGFITLFAPTGAQLKQLSSYMWDVLNIDNWRKIFADPMDAIIALTLIPTDVSRGANADVKVGNISTGISMATLSSQVQVVDCGTLDINEYWGGYLDYAPYTKISIYLPYIGFRPLRTDEVMNKTIHVMYYVDCMSGACVAQILCGEDLLYTFAGNMGYQIPVTSDNWSNWMSSIAQIAGAAITTVATGGATAPAVYAASSAASASVNMFKQDVDRSGTLAGNAGFLSDNYVYVSITRPRQVLPTNQNKYTGYPSLITSKLSDLNGYTVVRDIHLENISCTGAELSEIENLLKGGVIL